jgi:hypothetical protein
MHFYVIGRVNKSPPDLIRCIGLEQPELTPVEKKALVRNNETIFYEAGSLTPCG